MSTIHSPTYSLSEKVGAISIIIIVSGMAGALLGLAGGFWLPKFGKYGGFNIKPLLRHFTLPPLVGMIIMGCIARNWFGPATVPFPDAWASIIRNICLSLLLIRGGLQVSFKGKGFLVVVLSLIP